MSAHPLMTPAEVAEAFGVRVPAVKRWAQSGKLATLPDGRFFRAEVEAYLRGEPLSAARIEELRDQLTGGAR